MMPKTLRIGFIGSGGMAKAHTGAMEDFANLKFAAFCDVKRKKAKALAEKYEAEAFTDPAKMLQTMDLDAVWICLPPFAHGEAEFAALETGVPFFIEKPINKDLKQSAKIAAAIEKADLMTCVGYMNRYRKGVQAARKLLQEDPAVYAYGGWIGGTPISGDPDSIWAWWIQKDKSGGQFVEQVTHTIDLVRYLLGDAEAVSAFAAQGFNQGLRHYSIEDALAVSVKFKSGAVGNFCSCCASNARGGVWLDIYARGCALKLTGWEHSVEVFQQGKRKPRILAGEDNPFALEDRAFLRAVRTGDSSGLKTTYADGLKTLELTVAAAQSAEKGGKPITLKY